MIQSSASAEEKGDAPLEYLYIALGWIATNVVSLAVGAGAGYWFGPAVVSWLQGLLKKVV